MTAKKLIRVRPGKKVRIVVIDNSAVIRDALICLCASLPRLDVVGQAQNGIQGLEEIRRLRPDVITLDIRMPRMGGMEVLKTIKEKEIRCLAIVLSGVAERFYLQKCLALGAWLVFDKLTQIDELIQVLKSL